MTAADEGAPPPTVLLVDDHADTRAMYRFHLQGQGWRVLEAGDGTGVMLLVQQERPDVIVLDLLLPGVDGWTLTRQLRADATTSHLPVLALSGRVRDDERARAFDAGCTSFLAKPCLPIALEQELRRLTNSQCAGAS